MSSWAGFGKKQDPQAEGSKDGSPGPSVNPSTVRQGLSRMGTWAGAGKKPEEDDEEDDRHIRFTIGGAGRRLTKEDFLKEIQSLDPKARGEIIKESDAPAELKEMAKRDASDHTPGTGRIFGHKGAPSSSRGKGVMKEPRRRSPLILESDEEEERPRSRPTTAPKAVVRDPSSSASSGNNFESSAERRRREEAMKGVDEDDYPRGRSRDVDADDEEEMEETAAEKRRREAALGVGGGDSDSDDDDTERVPPPVSQRSRGIRFATSPVRGKN